MADIFDFFSNELEMKCFVL